MTVCVRKRPLNSKELNRQEHDCLSVRLSELQELELCILKKNEPLTLTPPPSPSGGQLLLTTTPLPPSSQSPPTIARWRTLTA
jgi:hypothetical protein